MGFILTAIIFFYIGTIYPTNKKSLRMSGIPAQFGSGEQMGQRNNRNILLNQNLFGNIISKDENSVTIETKSISNDKNMGSKIIFYSEKTEINKVTKGTTKDISVGQQVTITGKPNVDGSINAETISIKP